MSTRIPMEKLPNTRDLGGMTGAGGRTIRPGKLIRSGQLKDATPKDIEELARRVELILDFRNGEEHANVPDPEIPGVEQIHLPILDGRAPGVAQDEESHRAAMRSLFESPEKAKAIMTHVYEDFVSRPYCLDKYRQFLMLLAEDRQKAVLWHCAAGKDRAGFGAVLIQALLGVSREDILEDYMVTNVYLAEVIDRMCDEHAQLTGLTDQSHRDAMTYFFGAKIELITAALNKTDELYGGFDGLFEKGLQIPPDIQERMRGMYLV